MGRCIKLRIIKLCFLLFITVLFIIGCSDEKSVPNEPVKVKIMVHDKDTFIRFNGGYFAAKFPDIDLDIIDRTAMIDDGTPEEKPGDNLIKFIEREKPDLILLNSEQVIPLVDKGKLLQLDVIMEQEQFDSAGISTAMMDFFRKKGNGNIYAIAPTYTTSVIYYNIDLFNKHNIKPPHNQMTWEELFSLAAQFGQLSTADRPLYGFSDNVFPHRLNSVLNVAFTNNLSIVDSRGEKMQFDTNAWANVFQIVSDAMKSKALYTTNEDVKYVKADDNPFSRGEVAMQADGPSSAAKDIIGNPNTKLGVVTMPINPTAPEESAFVSLNEMYAINRDSENKQEAWRVLEYMISPEISNLKMKSYSSRQALPIRNSEKMEKLGEWDAKPFTMLKPSLQSGWSWDIIYKAKVPDSMKNEIRDAMLRTIDDIVKKDKSVKDALAVLQKEMQSKLDATKDK